VTTVEKTAALEDNRIPATNAVVNDFRAPFWGVCGTESIVTEAITGLLYQPRMMMGMEQSMQCLARETEVLGKEPSPMLLCPL
jgi:hypothetical protein